MSTGDEILYCRKCGAELKGDIEFCPVCGTPASPLAIPSGRARSLSRNSGSSTVRFVIDTELTLANFDDLLKFIIQHYILPLKGRFINVVRTTVDGQPLLSFAFLGPEERWYANVDVRTGKQIEVTIAPSDDMIPQKILNQLKEDLFIAVQLFEEQVRRTTLYFAWVENEPVILEKAPQRRRNIIYRLFTESMLMFFIVFIAASILLFMVLGPYTPMALVALQFVMVLFSDRIIARMGNWRITPEKPSVHIFQYHLPVEEYKDFSQRFNRETLMKMKIEIYEKTLAVGKPVSCETVNEVFARYGFKCVPENASAKTVNVYDIVKRVADRFKLPVPKIMIANTILPNAAASGPSPSRGIVLITTGLLVQLEDNEIFNVVGHEFSHLKGRDPLVLFGLTAGEYLLRFYVLWPLLVYFGFFYLFFALGAVFFVAKFFEGRADLEAASKLGQPKVLAEALRKIGFRKLQFERLPSYKIQGWVGWDPHPPIYFRVARLENLEAPEKVKHPLIQSVKDNIRGFLDSLSWV
ncbi:MAG: M48 family metalloprotease [Candidatus Bathyarchaeota archaeon]|nr:M48 family metalloprotease [Candidatus Bathyarchaeota archaeon]